MCQSINDNKVVVMCRFIVAFNKVLFVLICALVSVSTVFAQRRLSEMPRAERDSLLVKWAKEGQAHMIKRGFMGIHHAVDSVLIEEKWTNPSEEIPISEKYYLVRLYNKEAVKQKVFDFVYTVKVMILDNDGATRTLMAGSGIGYKLDRVPRYHVPKRPKEKRKGLGVEEFQP